MRVELALDDIRELLNELYSRLEAEGIQETISLVGGDAMALSGLERRVTIDIDGSYSSVLAIEKIVQQIADERGLPRDWLNSSATAFIPAGASWRPITVGGKYRLDLASPQTLLAMKLCSARDRDMEDLSFLIELLEIADPLEVAKIADDLYGDDDVAYSLLARQDAEIVAAQAIKHARKNSR